MTPKVLNLRPWQVGVKEQECPSPHPTGKFAVNRVRMKKPRLSQVGRR